MSREEIIQFVKSLNTSLDIQFLESLSQTELQGYVKHLKSIRRKTKNETKRAAVKAGVR